MASYRRIDFDTLAHEQEEQDEKMRHRWSQLFYQHLWVVWEDIPVHEVLERTMYASKFMAAIMEYEKTRDTAQWREFVKLFITQADARNRNKPNLNDTFGSPVPGPSTRASPAAHWTDTVMNWQTSSTVYFKNQPAGPAGATFADVRLGAIGTGIAAYGRQDFKPMSMPFQDLRRYNYNPNTPGGNGGYWRGGGGGGGRGGRAGYRYEQKSYIPAKAYLNQQLQQKEEEEKKKYETPTLQ